MTTSPESAAYRAGMEYAYERGVRADGTTATYPATGLLCSTCGEPSDYGIRVPLVPLRSMSQRVEPVVPVEVYLPCGHEVPQ